MIDVIIHASTENPSPPLSYDAHPGIHQSYCQLLHQLGYPKTELPVADFLRQYYGLAGSWLVASPIHWEATHNDATVRYADALLTLKDEESRYLFSIFAEFIAQYDMHLYYHDAKTWLIQAPDHPIGTTIPVHQLIDHSMSPALKVLEETPFWLRFITESQMFFSQEKSIVNGVWIWGGGTISPTPSMRPLFICGDEHWLGAAKQLSKEVDCFNRTDKILRNSVYFVPNEHWMKASHLEYHLQNYPVRWHWQNMTYCTKPKSWLSRLFRR